MRIYAIIFILMILAGCKTHDTETNYREGTDGIKMSFVDIDPVIYEGSPLYVVADLQNKGAFSETYGKVILRGFDPAIMPFEGTDDAKIVRKTMPEMAGKNPYNPEGGTSSVTFEIPKNHIILQGGEKYEPELVLSTCYYYETLATPKVCIIPDLSNMDDGVCTPEKIILKDQGAPVAVTKVEQQPMDGYVNFIVTIEDVGSGQVVALSEKAYMNCPHNLKHDDIDEVKVEMSMSNTAKPECTPKEYVRLSGGKGTMMCRFQIRPERVSEYDIENRNDNYEKELNIVVQYNYLEEIKKRIRIEKKPGSNPATGDHGEPEEDDSKNQDTAGSAGSSGGYACSCEDDNVCVCLFIGSATGVCNGDTEKPDFVVDNKDVELAVVGSDCSQIKKCGITGNMKRCDDSCSAKVTVHFDKPDVKKIAVIGSDGSRILASQYCTIEYKNG